MLDITTSKKSKYLLFSSLYFVQGIMIPINILIIPLYLIEKGFPIQITTLVVGIATIPWSIKFFWGGLVDYFIRHGRKKFIIIGGFQMAFGLFAAGLIDPLDSLFSFTFFIFLGVSGVVLLDAAVDAWAIETSEENERGKISGAMFAGRSLGSGFCALLFGYLANHYGYNYVFLVASFFVLIIVLYSILFKDTKVIKVSRKMFSILINEFKKKKTQLVSFFSFSLFIGVGIFGLVFPILLNTIFHLDVSQIGFILTFDPFVIAIGALIGGIISDKFGRKATISIYITTALIFTIIIAFTTILEFVIALNYAISIFYGGYLTGNFAIMMDVTNPKVGATQFSILTSITNAGEGIGNTISGSFVSLFGFSRTFLFSALFLGPPLLILYFIKFKKTNK